MDNSFDSCLPSPSKNCIDLNWRKHGIKPYLYKKKFVIEICVYSRTLQCRMFINQVNGTRLSILLFRDKKNRKRKIEREILGVERDLEQIAIPFYLHII